MIIQASKLTHNDGVIVISNMLRCAKALKKKVMVCEKNFHFRQGVVRKIRVHPRYGYVEFFCKGDRSGYDISGACWEFSIS